MRKIEQIDADIAAVEREVSDYETETRRQMEELRAARRDGLAEIQRRKSTLRGEQRDRLDADALADKHEWDGRKVKRLERKFSRGFSAREISREMIFGVVETVTSKTTWPDNTASWRKPGIGSAIVRLLKKDGSPGVKWEMLERGQYADKWELAK